MTENTFYKVTFYSSSQENFFRNYENAAAFLLESYFDDSEFTDEETIMDINNEVADTGAIDGYGCIEECWFDD